MDGLFANPRFNSFGPSRFAVSGELPLHGVVGPRPRVLREQVRLSAPGRPGVYGMLDESGELIYVGKAKSLRTRLLSYFRPRSRDPKAARIIRRARAIIWEHAPSEFAALLRELELIQHWRPRFNVQGLPRHKWRTYVCLGRRPAPYLFVTRRPPAGAVATFGPVSAGRRTRQAVRWLNDAFQLRDCPQAQEMIFADQTELFPVLRSPGCLRLEIGTCLGPCAAACTRTAYTESVQRVRAFLDGSRTELLRELQETMAAASAELAFERAAALRDKWEAFQGLHDELERLRVERDQLSFVYPVIGCDEDRWYLIQRGQVVRVLPKPTNAVTGREAARAIENVYFKPTLGAIRPAGVDLDTVLLVGAWFRRFQGERERVLTAEEAFALCSGRSLTSQAPRRQATDALRR